MTGALDTHRLWNRDFSVLWWTESVSFFGSQLTLFAMPIVALEMLGASASEVAWLNAAAGLGTLVFLGLFGPITDVIRRTTLMSWASWLRAATLGVVVALFMTQSLSVTALAVAGLIVTGLSGLYDSAFAALLPNVVSRRHLTPANSWVAGIRSAGDIGAGAVAGVVLQLLSPLWLFVGDLVTYVLSAIGIRAVREAGFAADEEHLSWRTYVQSLGSGFVLLRREPVMWPVTLSIAQFNLFTTAIQAVYITHALRSGAMTAAEVGIAGAIGGVTGLSATLVAPRIWAGARPIRILAVTFALPLLSACGIAILNPGLGLFNIVLLAASLGFWAACVMVNITGTETLKQVRLPNETVGRVSAASRLLTWGVDPVGAALAAVLAIFFPTAVVLAVAAVGVATSAIWVVGSRPVKELDLLADA
ncbi:MFS transporter [Microbacterium sp. lyk4-40-TSB-66]|uniref:MFS transporter n=1 Tax=Microbacterium sp. lyk4-40-TSB-66 TaxID=3040294 RepID=UPI00254FBB2B|nr:MFS transporter [Microbacterium sp. lyk4-40-TSB-66]